MREKGFNFWDIHFSGVLFVVEKDKSSYPMDICLFSTVGVIFEANNVADLIEQFGRLIW